MPRKLEVIITRLRIGHTKITHGFLMAKEDSPTCTACGVRYGNKHIFAKCRIYAQIRDETMVPDSLGVTFNQDHNSIAVPVKFITSTNFLNMI